MSHTLRVSLALAAVYLIWGSTYYAMRVALESLPPLLMAAVRFLIAGSVLYAVLRYRGAPRPTLAHWKRGALLGLFLLVGGNGVVAYAQQWASSSLAAIVVATMPLWMALFARLGGQAPSVSERAGLWIGFIGVVVLNAGGELSQLAPGALLLLLAPLSWAWGSMLSKQPGQAPGAMGLAILMIAGGATMLALGLLRGETLAAAPSGRSLVALGFLVVFGSLVALTAYQFLLVNVRPALATSYAYVNPLVAVAIGVGVGGEELHPATLAALGIVLAGVLLVTTGPYLERRIESLRGGRSRASLAPEPAPLSRNK